MSGSSGDNSSQKDSQSQSSNLNQDSQASEIQTLQKRFNRILIQAQKMISQQNFTEAVMKLNLLNEKINFLKQNQKQYDKKLQLICLYNLAAAYHKQWKLDDCIQIVEKFIIMLKGMLKQQQNKINHDFWYKMKKLLIKGQLQYCAILSQIGNHQYALKTAIEVSQSLKQLFKKGYNQINIFLEKFLKNDQPKGLYSSINSNMDEYPGKKDKIQFSKNVLTKAKQILSQLVNMETYDQVIKQNYEKVCQGLIQLKSKTYFWKDNPQNNIKLLKKQLNQHKQQKNYCTQNNENGQRNLLGIKKSTSWIEQFTIAKVMVMSPINYFEFTENDNLVYQFNQKNLIEKIILVSVNYFSLAIEIRFIQQMDKKKLQTSKIQQKNILSVHNQNNQNKVLKIKKSEVFHLKSIILLCQMIKQNSAFLNHLVTNYHKHYKQDLIPIEQECSMAEYSHIYQIGRSKANSFLYKNNQKVNGNLQEYQTNNQNNKINIFSQPSAYFQDEQIKKSINSYKKDNLIKIPIYEINKKKSNIKKKSGILLDSSQQLSNKLKNSISLSILNNNDNTNIEMKSARYSKYETKKSSSKEKTLKKISIGKMIAFNSPIKLELYESKQKDKSYDKSISIGGVKGLKSQQKKSFSIKNINSLSINKSSMNSTTLRSKKKISQKQKQSGKQKQKIQLKQLKQSYEFKIKDFKKKQKILGLDSQRIDKQKKDKRKQKLNNGLMLLKKSTSNPNLIKKSSSPLSSQSKIDKQFICIKQKSKKILPKK